MSTIVAPTPRSRSQRLGPVRFVRDTALLTGRSLRAIPRVPERLLDVTIQPIIFILLFLYVFGSAIHVTGISYKDCLILGWNPQLTVLHGLELAGLMVLGMFAFTWAGVLAGMLVRSPDAMQGVG